jgi:hypothetical protein
MQINKTNQDWMRQEYERREAEKKTRGSGDLPKIQRYTWKSPENWVRVLPSWALHGRPFRREADHWGLMPGNAHFRCIHLTWPDRFEKCSICTAIEHILSRCPTVKMNRQFPSSKYACNLIDRHEEEKGPQIGRLVPSLYDWILAEGARLENIDLFDYEHGFDLRVALTMKNTKGKNKKQIKDYKPSWPNVALIGGSAVPKGCPVSEDDDKMAAWLDNLFDLDAILKVPDEAELATIHTFARKMFAYYVEKYGGGLKKSSHAGPEKRESRPAKSDEPPPPSDEDFPTDDLPDDGVVERASTTKESSKESRKETTAVVAEPTTPPPEKQEEPKTRGSLTDTSGYPSCFLGLEVPEAHDGEGIPQDVVGTYGFSSYLDKCLLCVYDIQCMDLKKAQGL